MREMVSFGAAAGALLVAFACTTNVEVGYDAPGGGSGLTQGASTTGSVSSSGSSSGVGGADTTVALSPIHI